MRCVLLAAWALVACGQPRPHTPRVTLNILALDAKGHPVTDLASAGFRIYDDGKLQTIASFKPGAAHSQPPTTLIFFDLLNSVSGHREYISTQIVRALEPLGTDASVYLYILTTHGEIYPVHALPPPAGKAQEDESAAATPWTGKAHVLLDRAIQDVYALPHMDNNDRGLRSAATFYALSQLGDQLAQLPGPTTIVWITKGVASVLKYPDGCHETRFGGAWGTYLAGVCNSDCTKFIGGPCLDYTPFLRHFTTELDRNGALVYSVEDTVEGRLPPSGLGTSKDTLEQLATLTGGRMYIGGEVAKAIAESLQDARARYQLAYDAPPPDGKYHKLRVACSRKGVRIEAQRGYFADRQ